MSGWDDLLERAVAAAPMLLANRVVAEFEPMPASLSYRPSHAQLVRSAISATDHDGFAVFPEPIGRNPFLAGAFEHLAPIRDHEELLVAFGRRRGADDASPSRLEGLWRGIGSHDQVGITSRLRDIIEKQARAIDSCEMIFIHNHPEHDIKSLVRLLFGWTPLASSPDRDAAVGMNARAAVQTLWGPSSHYRFYIVDEEQLARFWLPSVESFLAAFRAMGWIG
jgi:hypothetical protein